MKFRARRSVLSGVLLLGLAGCSLGTSSKSTKGTTTVARSVTTLRIAPTVSTTATTTLTTAPPISPSSQVSATTGSATTAAGRVVSSPSDNVQRGDSGSGVKQIQNALIAQGYAITADGQFGALTEQAVKTFQSKHSLKQDGIVGPATWAKLKTTTVTTTVAKTTTTLKP